MESNKSSDKYIKIELSKKELETVFDSINEMICIVDSDYKIVRVNKEYAGFVGQSIQNLLGKKCYKVFWDCDQICANCPSRDTFLTNKVCLRKNTIKKSSDDVKYFELRTFPVFDSNDHIMHVIEFIKDVTEEKRMIEQLIRSEKLASIGIMTAGLAHEMNNPLSGISGTAVNLLEMPQKYGLNEKGISRIKTILESAEHATLIMKDLLHLSKKNSSIQVAVDLNKLIIKTVNGLKVVGSDDIHKEFNLDDSLGSIICDPTKIDQVILNIVTNALQSIIEKKQMCQSQKEDFFGSLFITTKRRKSSVLITISDNGIGISQDIRSKVFDPFFSTKPAGQGIGMGLSICHRIIEEHRGKIFFECIDDRTVFSIVLPLGSKPIWITN